MLCSRSFEIQELKVVCSCWVLEPGACLYQLGLRFDSKSAPSVTQLGAFDVGGTESRLEGLMRTR
jgi:hypothetical protein